MMGLNFIEKFCRLIERLMEDFQVIEGVRFIGMDALGEEFEIGESGWKDRIDRTHLIVTPKDKSLRRRVERLAKKLSVPNWEVWDISYEGLLNVGMSWKPYSDEVFFEWIYKIKEILNFELREDELKSGYTILGVYGHSPSEKEKEDLAEVIESLPYWMIHAGWGRQSSGYMHVFAGTEDTSFSFKNKMSQWFDGKTFVKEYGKR